MSRNRTSGRFVFWWVRNDPPSPTPAAGGPGAPLTGAPDQRRINGTPQTALNAAKGPDGCGEARPGTVWAQEGVQAPRRMDWPSGGIGPARGGTTLRQRQAAGRVSMQRYGVLWSAQGATKLDHSEIEPFALRLPT